MAIEAVSGDPIHSQMESLLSGVSRHGDQHLAEVERDLAQMDGLLEEAIQTLCSSFMAIHQAVDQQQEALDSLLAEDLSAPDYAARLNAIQGEISLHVGAAVTGLQFQDMTAQLIGRIAQHLTGLRDVFGMLGMNPVFYHDITAASPQERLSLISGRVNAHVSEQSGGLRSVVKQRHLKSGEIELF